MALSLKPEHLKRYRDISGLLLKYGRSDLVRGAGAGEALLPGDSEDHGESADALKLAQDLEHLGPTYVKLGQLLSTRADLFPPPVLEALSRLQDDIEPMPFATVERIVAEELGVRLSKAFQEFEQEPLAAASLGQVHRARLRDGCPVAVKVQREGIRDTVRRDLEALDELASMAREHSGTAQRYQLAEVFDQFRSALTRELDYRGEAANMRRLAGQLEEFDEIVVPLPVDDYTTDRVLTMDYVRGTKVTGLSPLARMEFDGAALADVLFEAYMKQVLVDGWFHADPHPGNVFLTDDRRLALIDVGLMEQVRPRLREGLLRLVLAAGEANGDDAAEQALRISTFGPQADKEAFRSRVATLVSRQESAGGDGIRIGRVLLELFRIAGGTDVRMPAELSMLGKTMLHLEEVALTLDPAFDPNVAVQRHAGSIMRRHMLRRVSPGSVLSAATELVDVAQRLPGRINRAMDVLERGELHVRVHALDEARLMKGLRSMANRITLGLMVAGLIVGAALMARVETAGRILGYPAIAFLLFMIAAIAAIVLGVRILWFDRDRPES